jgi:hypothetical protein
VGLTSAARAQRIGTHSRQRCIAALRLCGPVTRRRSEGTTEALPPLPTRVENLLQVIGIAIFVALRVGAAVILIKQNVRR